ncbi:hypothetical protein EON65_50015 [archaeon]|nr:MAG: hypothetical protein EON65_50015 [archaeon]
MMIAGWSPTSLDPAAPSGLPDVPQSVEEGKLEDRIISPPNCLRDIIAKNKDFYRFSVLTGVIKPLKGENPSYSFTNLNLRYRTWVYYLHCGLFLSSLTMIIYGIVALASPGAEKYASVIIAEVFGILVQNVLLYPVIIFLRRELASSREIDTEVYNESMSYAMHLGRNLFLALTAMMICFIGFVVSVQPPDIGWLFGLYLIFIFTPSNCFMTGAFTFLVMEQRLSFHAMQGAEKQVMDRSLTPSLYMQIRESIDYRDKLSPLNWLMAAAVFNTICAMVLIGSLGAAVESETEIDIFGGVMFTLSTFGRQILVLLMLLNEMANVNALSETMLHKLVQDAWGDDKIMRFDLYILMKEKPLGSSLFYFRPSKWTLLVQIVSAVTGLIVAIFWAFVFA